MVQVPSQIPDRGAAKREPVAVGSRPRLRLAADPVETALSGLRAQSMVRLGPVDVRHVQALAEVAELWPPILVATATMTVLDGMHRVEAARRLGRTSILARFFDGSDEEGFVAAVRANVAHGLPLSLAERSQAARRLLSANAGRSDRSIGAICGLDHKTVARLRDQTGCPSGAVPQVDVRVGRDQRNRPLDAAGLRMRIAAAVAAAPEQSLRQIAHQVGASPETVRDVRARLARGDDPVPDGAARTTPKTPPPSVGPPWPAWAADSACRSAPVPAGFAAWFDAARASLEWPRYLEAVPLSRAYQIADQARAYADAWRNFADRLERRTQTTAP